MLKKLEFSFEDFLKLKSYCQQKKIDFLSTPFDEESVNMLEDLGVTAYKMSSGDITNKPLLTYVAKKGKPMIVSTGMCTLAEVENAVRWIEDCGNFQITLLHCTSNYPAPFEDVNMKAMDTLRAAFGYSVGYSDHTEGMEIPLMAVSREAEVIEKHFTLDRNMEGPDHKASLEPDELKCMVEGIRRIEAAIGDGRKGPTMSELSTRAVARKSLVAKHLLKKGMVIKAEDIIVKRPGTGIAPEYLETVIGKKLKGNLEKDFLFKWEDLE